MSSPTLTFYNTTSILEANVSAGENMFVKMLQFVSNPDPSVVSFTDYMPGVLILLTLLSIIFISMKARGFSTMGSFFATSLVVMTAAILLYPLQVISGIILVSSIALFLVSIGIIWFTS
jgi:hypothetical protein